jgi:fumarate reductase flavoprotein subunit
MNTDIIVVGAGFAGLTTALRGAELGLRVIVLERGDGDEYLCNSRWSGGYLHMGMDDPCAQPDFLEKLITGLTVGLPDQILAPVFAQAGRRAVEWLRGHEVKFMRLGNHPGRQWIMAPPRRGQPGLDWKGRGPDDTLKRLGLKFIAKGGEIRKRSRATGLHIEGGQCVGVDFDCNGKSESIAASAVVLADGGFQADMELLKRFISPAPERVMQRNAGTGTGDGLRMAEKAGAKLIGMDGFYGHPLSLDAFSNPQLWPHPYLDAMVMTSIAVGADGQRFADEGMSGVHVANAIVKRTDPLDTFVVYDSVVWEGPAADMSVPPPPNPVIKNVGATMYSANTLEELAEKAGINAQGLAKTVADYNDALAAGTLEALPVKRTSARYKPYAVLKAPFYAVPMCAGITYTMGGPAIDANARVRHKNGGVIEGLFAAGSASGGLEGGDNAGYVGGLIKAFLTGILAAEFIASQKSGK